jgi:hypothetical protein
MVARGGTGLLFVELIYVPKSGSFATLRMASSWVSEVVSAGGPLFDYDAEVVEALDGGLDVAAD